MTRHTIVVLLALSFLGLQSAEADLVISVEPTSDAYLVGDVGRADVFIHSNNSPNDELDSFFFDLRVEGGSGVAFETPPSRDFMTKSDYVFFDRSLNVAGDFSALVSDSGATLSFSDVSNDTTTEDALPKMIPDSSSPLLLGSFSFLANSPGDFTIGLGSSSFGDADFETIGYTSTGGSFRVTAVPEPGSFAVLALAAAGVCFLRKRRSRSNSAANAAGWHQCRRRRTTRSPKPHD